MLFKLIKYILIILLSIILFTCIPKEYNPISNIYLFTLLFLLIYYFFENSGIFEYFYNTPNTQITSDTEIIDDIPLSEIEDNNDLSTNKILNNDLSTNKILNNENLLTLDNIFININHLILPYLENIILINDNNIIKIKQELIEIITDIKQKYDPYKIYLKCEKINNYLIKDTEIYILFNHILNIFKSIIFNRPININYELIKNNNNNNNIFNNKDILIYIKKHFLPLFENFILKMFSYTLLSNKLKLQIEEIINLINNDLSASELLIKIKNIYNLILLLLKDLDIVKDNIAKTYLLLSKVTIDIIIKNLKLLILQESINIQLDIDNLVKETELIMKTNLGKILKLNISLESKIFENSNIQTYISVEFNSNIESISVNNNDNSIIQISDMLKKLASNLEKNNNDCNCEKKVDEAIQKYLKNGKYIDDNGIIQNIINSDMIYNQLDLNMLQSLGSYDDTFSNKWDKGYTYLDTAKWAVPRVAVAPAPNINNVKSSLTNGYPINLLEFDNSRKVLGPDNINLNYIKDKLN